MVNLGHNGPMIRRNNEINRGYCGVCSFLFIIRDDGTLATHDFANERCSGSNGRPVAADSPEMNIGTAEFARRSGIGKRKLERWTKENRIRTLPRRLGSGKEATFNRYSPAEVDVAVTMERLLSAGWGDLDAAERIARARARDLDVMRAVGYDGESNATEHTLGDGLVLTITD